MKVGMRKPSLKKSVSARTTGKAKRAVKKAVVPGYGKKGTGLIKNPKKAVYNKIYNKTTFGINDVYKGFSSSSASTCSYSNNSVSGSDVLQQCSDPMYSIDPELEKILTSKEKKKYLSLIQVGYILDQDRDSLMSADGKRTKISTYKICSIIFLIFAILLFLLGLLCFSSSIVVGMIFVAFGIVCFALSSSYKTIINMHKKIFSLKDKDYLSSC